MPLLALVALFTGVLPAAGSALPFLTDADEAEPEGTEALTEPALPADDPPTKATVELTQDAPEGVDPGVIEGRLPVADRRGYLSGVDNGISLVQTTRVDSPTHEGWVDITLDLVATNFSRDPLFESGVTLSGDGTEACLASETGASDCFRVEWGSEEQFKATLLLRRAGTATWAVQKAEVIAVIFEVPANAQRASLVYGEHRISIPLGGQVPPDLTGWTPAAPQRPEPEPGAPVGTDGYFVGQLHGLAVTNLTRETHPSEPTWVLITLAVDVMSFRDSDELDLPITVNATSRSLCFSYEEHDDCLAVRWGEFGQFDAILTLDRANGTFNWPRSKGWPATITFAVPSNALRATLLFADNTARLDLRGEVGERPAWDYTAHYEPLTGLTLHDAAGQSIDLIAIDHDHDNGDVLLVFEAVNRRENRDFRPRVTFSGGRVSAGGQTLDGVGDPRDGWSVVTRSVVVPTLAPGRSLRFNLVLPRVEGDGFAVVEHSIDPPEAMLLRLFADNRTGNDGPSPDATRFQPFYAAYDKTGKAQATFYYPDLGITAIELSPPAPTVGFSVLVSFLVSNHGPRNAQATTLDFSVNGAKLATLAVPALPAHGTAVIDATWVATLGEAELSGVIDPGDAIEEAVTENNTYTLSFAGGELPDLKVGDIVLSLASATGDTPLSYQVEVMNVGTGDAITTQVAVYAGDRTKPEFFVSYPAIPSGASATLTFPWTTGIGSQTIRIVADGFGNLLESDETNNTAWAPLPDLTFTPKLGIDEIEAVNSRLSFEIQNASTVTAPAFAVTIVFDDDADEATTVIIGPLLPNEKFTLSVPANTDGRHRFKATLDLSRSLPEADETNNVLAFTYTVGPLADLRIIEVVNRPSGASEGQTVNTRVELVNGGEKASGKFKATLYELASGAKVGEAEVPSLDPGERYAFKLDWIVPTDATGVRVVLDEAEVVAETNELDNEAQAGL